jgi:hypothetical protein
LPSWQLSGSADFPAKLDPTVKRASLTSLPENHRASAGQEGAGSGPGKALEGKQLEQENNVAR